MPEFTTEIFTASVKVSIAIRAAAKFTWGVLSSDRAQSFYKAVLVVLIVIIAIAAMGIWEGVKLAVEALQPKVAIAIAWVRDRAVQGWASFVAWLRSVRAEVEGFLVLIMEGAIGL